MNNHKDLDQADSLREEVQREAERLPSRSELHAHKHKKASKTKWKLRFPFVRLVGILFLLIPITILAIHFNGKDSNVFNKLFTSPVKNVEPITLPVTASANSDVKEEDEAQPDLSDAVVEGEDTQAESSSITEVESNEETSQHEEESPAINDEGVDSQESPEETEEAPPAETESSVEYIEHVVEENENLFRISMKYYGSREGEQIISDHNNLVDGQVNVGQTIIIPINR